MIEKLTKGSGLWNQWLKPGFGWIFLSGYYSWFAAPALFANYAPDDILNLRYYWFQGTWKLIWANFKIWTSYYRPFGGIYYLSLFTLFGLNPIPYRAVSLLLLSLNTFLAYRLAAQLFQSRGKAFLVGFLVVFHPGLANLLYTNSFIYDILCGTFFLGAFNYYGSKRKTGSRLNPWHCAIFLCLYQCALNSKEMAVSLPLLVLCYELIVHRPILQGHIQTVSQKIKSLAWRMLHQGKAALLAAFLTLLFLGGKMTGPESMTQMGAYHPVLTWGRFLDSNARFLNELFGQTGCFNPAKLLIVWGAILGYAFLRKSAVLKFLWCWVFITPWPIAFLPGRNGGCLYLVWLGWALIGTQLLFDLASFIGEEISFKHLPGVSLKMPVIVLTMIFFGDWTTNHLHHALPVLLRNGDKTWNVIQELQSFHLRPAVGSKILLTDEPFDSFDTVFIAELVWNRHDLVVLSQSHSRLDEKDQCRMDYILSFKKGLHIERANR
jgi:hypothetical protein